MGLCPDCRKLAQMTEVFKSHTTGKKVCDRCGRIYY